MISLANDIYHAVISIDAGRKGWAIKGKEPEGRIAFEDYGQAEKSIDGLIYGKI
jgi:hypothetical protein